MNQSDVYVSYYVLYYFLGKRKNVQPQLGLIYIWMVTRSIQVHSTGEFTEALLTGTTTPDFQFNHIW